MKNPWDEYIARRGIRLRWVVLAFLSYCGVREEFEALYGEPPDSYLATTHGSWLCLPKEVSSPLRERMDWGVILYRLKLKLRVDQISL